MQIAMEIVLWKINKIDGKIMLVCVLKQIWSYGVDVLCEGFFL